MCDVPFFPILPICFQCGTDQNPCRCKVVGPTLVLVCRIYLYGCRCCHLLPGIDLLRVLFDEDRQGCPGVSGQGEWGC
ncbi:hypothetical protein BO86DRAFT_3847 [Aspergillus japonicus CBS 114.51]|uniref:Uncharacterized protein n=1 Tax=Aspergillus japonicus CBS 114.51 TaxID=1448312 RepID=A0A8T8XGR6_ASPJA|nr:hypothetical protein BO86DRAFT_3847 [Aspergillus japonicus CBS 114.51]RAH87466.1 hypothetical protein BO86DRAFT_3847 [Aspergillus japonicus CBS 114.51]